MKQHTYRITVTHVADADGQPVADRTLEFTARNHDDLFAIVERVKARPEFTGDEAAAFAIGLKLFGETLLERRREEPYSTLVESFGAFMKLFKRGAA